MSEQNSTTEIDLDLLDEDSIEEVVEINPNANPLDEPAPVSDGVHRVKVLSKGEGAWNHKEWVGSKDGVKHPYLTCAISLQVLDEGPDFNKRIFPQALNTIVFDGKNEMAFLLIQILGGSAEAKEHVASLNNYVKLAKAFKEALKAEPIVRAETKWVAQYKTGEKKKGKDVWRTALSGQKNFKKRGDDTFDPEISTKGQDLKARATVVDYFPDEN